MTRIFTVSCPACRAEVKWSEASPWRPFCSARCRALDLGDWSSERFVIPGHDLTDRPAEDMQPAVELKQ